VAAAIDRYGMVWITVPLSRLRSTAFSGSRPSSTSSSLVFVPSGTRVLMSPNDSGGALAFAGAWSLGASPGTLVFSTGGFGGALDGVVAATAGRGGGPAGTAFGGAVRVAAGGPVGVGPDAAVGVAPADSTRVAAAMAG